MAAVPSNMLPLGTKAPDFTLTDTISGKKLSPGDLTGDKGLLVAFICNHCPYVKHIETRFLEIARTYQAKGIGFAAISSNDVDNYPEDSPEKMAELAESHGYTFPYLYDETQEVAKSFQAACTPDFYLFDNNLKLVYRGRMDGSTPKNEEPVTGNELVSALDKLLSGQQIMDDQFPSIGCNIKWKS